MSTVIPGGLAASYSQKQAQKPATSRAVPGTLVLRDSVGRINARSALFTNSGGFVGDPVDDPTQVPLTAKVTIDSTAFGIFNKQGQSCFAINVGPSTDSSNRGTIDFFDRFDGTWRRSFSLKTGNVGISNNNPQTPLHNSKPVDTAAAHPFRAGILTEDEGSGISGRIGIRSANAIGEAPYVLFYRSRGTLASPAAVQSDDTLGGVLASTYNGSAWSGGGVGGSMLFRASENWTTSANGSYITFSTTPNGSTGSQERLRIKANGQVRFVPLASAPANPEVGDIYYDSSNNRLRVYIDTGWTNLH
jgi:hypothetical protein